MPVRAASILGFALSGLGAVYALIVILGRLLFGIDAEGWSSLMVVVLVIGGAQMVMIGILGEYLWRNLDETRKRPRFIIETMTEGAPKRETGETADATHPVSTPPAN